MRLKNDVRIAEFFFDFPGTPPDTGSGTGAGWVKKITKTAGSPTVTIANGEAKLHLDAQEEVQNLCLYMDDVLPFDIEHLQFVEIACRLGAGLAAGVDFAIGVAGARNDAIDSIAYHALFRVLGDTGGKLAVTCETEDGVNDVDDKATGINLGTTDHSLLHIDFASGVLTKSPPSQSVGGRSNVLFSQSNSRGQLRRVCELTTFDMVNYTGNLQLIAQLQKTASTSTGDAYIRGFRVGYKLP